MLSEESAIGKCPEETVKMMAIIAPLKMLFHIDASPALNPIAGFCRLPASKVHTIFRHFHSAFIHFYESSNRQLGRGDFNDN